MRSSQEVLSQGCDLASVTDGNWTIIPVGVIVDRLLVVLELCIDIGTYYGSFMQIRTRFIRGMRSTKVINMDAKYWYGPITHTLGCPSLSLEVICRIFGYLQRRLLS